MISPTSRVLVSIVLSVSPLYAIAKYDYPTGKDLIEQCDSLGKWANTARNGFSRGHCEGWFHGFFGGLTIASTMFEVNRPLFCLTLPADDESVRKKVLAVLRSNPDFHDELAGTALLHAIQRAFPCP